MPPRRGLCNALPDMLSTPAHSQLWTERYEPKDITELPFHEVKKHPTALRTIFDTAFQIRNQFARLVLIFGPYGSGKTTLVKTVCRMDSISILEFSPDDDYYVESQELRETLPRGTFLTPDKIFNPSVRAFLSRAQLSHVEGTDKAPRHIILFDNFIIPPNQGIEFTRALREYNEAFEFRFPIVWVVDPAQERYATEDYLGCFYKIQLNPTPMTVMKRTINRIAPLEGIRPTKDLIEALTADNIGDIRSLVNNFQFARSFSSGGYDSLTFYQALGEVLYQKRKRTPEALVVLSRSDPRRFLYSLFDNYNAFYTDIEDLSAAADYFSMADVLLGEAFGDPERQESAAALAARAAIELNAHPVPLAFRPMKQGFKSTLRYGDRRNEEFRCWPRTAVSMRPSDVEAAVFREDERSAAFEGRREKRHELVKTPEEAAAEAEILAEDPIEVDEDFFD